MPRKPGSKNRPKDVIEAEKAAKAAKKAAGGIAAASAPRPGEVGHNSELTEAEKQNRLILGLVEIEKIEKEKDAAVARIRNERKRLASFGFSKIEVDFALELRKEKNEESVERWNRMRRIARFLNHPIGTQTDLFDAAAPADPIADASKAGEIAGLEGQACKPPMAPDSAEGQAWIEGWHRGNASKMGAMANAMEGRPGAPPTADTAFDDAVDDKPAADGATEADHAAGRRAWMDQLKGNNDSGDALARETSAKIAADRAAEAVAG